MVFNNPFYFSSINSSMVSQWPSDSINLMWNQLNQKNMTNSILFMTPSINTAIYDFPEFTNWGNNLLNPMLAIQQTIQSFNNGNWMNLGGNNGGFNWDNMWKNFKNPWGNNSGNSSISSDNLEYDALKALIDKYKDMYGETQAIKDALDKTGTSDEKLLALKEAYKTLNSKKLEKALLELPEYKNILEAAGYKYGRTDNDSDATKKLRTNVASIHSELSAGKWDKLAATYGANDEQGEILQVISSWNDKYSGNEERSILRLCANHIGDSDEEKILQRNILRNLVGSLNQKAAELESEFDTPCPKLKEAMTAMLEASADLGSTDEDLADFTKRNVNKLAEKFENLYAIIRLMQAELIRNDIKTKYGFLNNISSNDKDFVNDNLVINATMSDLKAEGINIDNIEIDVIEEESDEVNDEIIDIDDEYETPEEKLEALKDNDKLKKSANENVYETKTDSQNVTKHFYMANGENLVELKDVKAIDKDGNCTMLDGSVKKLADVEKINVTAENIQNYNNAINRVEKLINNKIHMMTNSDLPADKSKGVIVYYSEGCDKKHNRQYFMIKDNELVKINGIVLEDGNVKFEDGTKKHLTTLTSDDVSSFEDSNILTENEAETAKYKTDREETKQLLIETYNCKEPEDGIYTIPSTDCKLKINNKGELVLAEDCSIKYITTENSKETIAGKKYKKDTIIDENTLQNYINALKSTINTTTGKSSNLGRQFAKDLMGRTNIEEETRAVNLLFDNVNAYNIKDFIKEYDGREGFGNDKICEQIITEYNFKNSKQKGIRRIITLVLEYCDMNNLNVDSTAYKRLKEKLETISDSDYAQGESRLNSRDCRYIDHDILTVLNIK